MRVPFFPYDKIFQEDKKAYLQIFDKVSSRGAFILQKEVNEFEQKLAELAESRFAISLANATDAIQLGLMASGIQEGDEVIISSHTMIATASAVKFAGGIPVPVECGDDHLIDPVSIEQAITDKTFAIMPTQLNGRVSNMDPIMELAAKYNLQIHEDSAQALGARFKGRSAGTFGMTGCISFYPAKTLGCFGDGGALFCQDQDIYEHIMLMRDHGRNDENDVVLWGMNSRLDNIQAEFLLHKLKTYQRSIERRREIANLYCELLNQTEQIKLPPPPDEGDHYDVFQNFEIEAVDRDKLKITLAEKGIGTLIQWSGKAVHHFNKLGFDQQLPRTDDLFSKMLMLPLTHMTSDEEVIYVCEEINKFYK